jgi:hypothetical protein
VVVAECGVFRIYPRGSFEWVLWSDLVSVRIVTTSGGPFLDDVFWVLSGRDGSACVVPNGREEDLLPRLQKLPGFDHNAVINAMTCTDDAEFLCWTAPSFDPDPELPPSPSQTPPEGPIDGQDSTSL